MIEWIIFFIVGRFLASLLSKPFAWVVQKSEKLAGGLDRTFRGRRFTVLGHNQSGKTSLLLYLTYGHPYEIVDGEKRTPDRTGAVEYRPIIVGDPDIMGDIKKLPRVTDVGGDDAWVPYWKEAIEYTDPHGIIFMIDVRDVLSSITEGTSRYNKAWDKLVTYVMPYVKPNTKSIKAFYIFLNFCDQVDSQESFKAMNSVENRLRKEYGTYLRGVKTAVMLVHLNPEDEDWPRVKTALSSFAADIS